MRPRRRPLRRGLQGADRRGGDDRRGPAAGVGRGRRALVQEHRRGVLRSARDRVPRGRRGSGQGARRARVARRLREPAGAARRLLGGVRATQGRALGARLRGPAAGGGAAARDRWGGPRARARALPPRDGRRVPGHEPGPAAADRAAPRRGREPVRGRRRAPVDLRLPARRRRGLPPDPEDVRGGARRGGRGDAAGRQLPLGPRRRRGDQRARLATDEGRLRAADGRVRA